MNLTADISKSNLVINRLTRAQFDALALSSLIKDNEIYLVEETELNAQGKKITNLLSGSLSCDAVTLAQLSSALSSIDLSEYYKKSETSSAWDLSAEFRDLSDSYYLQTETSSAAEISTALENVSVDLSEYYKKTETSGASEISTALNNKVLFRQWTAI